MGWRPERQWLKPLLARAGYREGAVRTILWGPGRGLRYRIFAEFGLAPLYGGWEPAAQRLLVQHLRPGAVAYDVGANRGVHTLLMARRVGPRGHVYTFEPVPEIFAELQDNVALNGFTNVTCLPLAVSDTSGPAGFFRGHHSGAGHLASTGDAVGESLTVETVTLDELVFQRSQRPPDLIKVDVEGAESRVLSGAMRILQRFRPALLIDLHRPDQGLAVGEILLRFRYAAYGPKSGEKVRDLTRGWPDADGLWEQLIAFPQRRGP